MKKIVTSVLLAGLFLGTTSPVFAVDGETTQNTDVKSIIAATYEVSIPTELSIDLMGGVSNDTGPVALDSLTAAGAVSVKATVNDLLLEGGTGSANEKLVTTIQDDAGTPAKIIDFSLTNDLLTKNITVGTKDLSKNKLPGTYTGTIDFVFDYVEADPASEE